MFAVYSTSQSVGYFRLDSRPVSIHTYVHTVHTYTRIYTCTCTYVYQPDRQTQVYRIDSSIPEQLTLSCCVSSWHRCCDSAVLCSNCNVVFMFVFVHQFISMSLCFTANVCRSVVTDLIHWPVTTSGKTALVPCPEGQDGTSIQ